MDEYGWLDATAQAELVHRREVKPDELVEAALARIERLDPALGAVVTPIEPTAPMEGPFTGVPFLVKDLGVELAGTRFTEGSRWQATHTSPHDQVLAVRYRRAGLVVLGKTNTCEFGLSPTCEPALFGPTRGRVPLGPRYGDLGPRLGCEHALTRSVRDSAALLDAVSGPEPDDPYRAPAPARPFLAEVGTDPGRLRIALCTRPRGGQQVNPAHAAATRSVAELLEGLGHHVEEAVPDGLDDETYGPSLHTVYRAAVAWIMAHRCREMGRPPATGEIEPQTAAYWEQARGVGAADYSAAVEALQRISRRVAGWFQRYDAWLTPTLGGPPPLLGELVGTEADPLRGARNAGRFLMFDGELANVTGNPAMSLPAGHTSDGLPIGVHVLGRFGDEATLLRLAAQLEAAIPWAHRHPEPSSLTEKELQA